MVCIKIAEIIHSLSGEKGFDYFNNKGGLNEALQNY